ncbi:hypothetical protein HAX54_037632 [Datura stramonium]|uniref:Uncharacterized protein n=1 Tax=Datura stramonium TaxID=4076 RepID=A0ABS8VMH9_DATST|nr:hypothetical protein [Datura stramonium]
MKEVGRREFVELLFISPKEDNKSQAIASAFHQRFLAVIDRCRSLPSIQLRSRFLKLTGAPIIHRFLGCVLFRCQEAEGLTALTDDDALMKVAKSVTQLDTSTDGNDFSSEESSGNGILYEEIKKLEEFRTGWVEKLSTGKMSVLEEGLNRMDFVGVWRSLALGLDKLIFYGILMTNAKFSVVELRGLAMICQFYSVFRAWCLRPEVSSQIE